MGKVVAQANMSLDGYVAKQDNTIGRLFDWLQNGEVEIPTPAGDFAVHLTPPSAEHWRRWVSSARRAGVRPDAVRGGRGLAGSPHTGRPRRRGDAPGPHRLGRRTSRGAVHLRDRRCRGRDRSGTVSSPATVSSRSPVAPSPGSACELGLLDEVAVDLVPVVMGAGNRPFFGKLSSEDVLLGNPTVCVQGDRVTHLVFPVMR